MRKFIHMMLLATLAASFLTACAAQRPGRMVYNPATGEREYRGE